jgi:4-hydroxy-3-polyprenylbenzoate decarboxylase
MTGASGHLYTRALIEALVAADVDVDLSITDAGRKVLHHELGVDARPLEEDGDARTWLGDEVGARVRVFTSDAIEAPPSSGTAGTLAVVICPCSMGTLGRVSAGFSSNLVERAADVALKEGRRLLIVPRETPLSVVHLENLLRLARLGAAVLPAMPGFYHHPRDIADLVDHVVGKVMDRLGLPHERGARWSGLDEPLPEPGTGSPPAAEPSA